MRIREEDSLSVPNESAGVVLATLTRIPEVYAARWQNGRVYWKVDVPPHEELCAHLKIRRKVERAVALHEVQK